MSKSELFPGFENRDVTIPVGESQSGESRSGQTRSGETRIHLRLGGSGPPLLLLHGYPQSHVAWHKVAPILAPHFRLVIPDLPGYGDSLGPPRSDDHTHHSKRVTAAVFVELMSTLGHDRFDVAAHDRGARVGYRMALDHPDRVKRLASLDTVPTLDIWEAADKDFAIDAFHWPLLAQPAPFPERLIGADPDGFLDQLLTTWAGSANALDPAAVAEYRRCFHKPSVLEAMSEDYRAGATLDLLHDQADRDGGRRVLCPVFVPWGQRYTLSSPESVWQRWADDVRTLPLDCGHFIAEELPEACAHGLLDFFNPKGS